MSKLPVDPDSKHARLRMARINRGFDSAKIAAEALGIAYGTYSGYEGGTRWFGDDAEFDRVARYFRVSPDWVLFGRGAPTSNRIVAVVGKIAAGNLITVEAEQVSEGEPLFEIELDFPVSPNSFALQVSGDSMYPRYDDGDVVIASRAGRDPSSLIGREAIVATQDHNRFLKLIAEETEPGHFTLESFNARAMRNVPLIWASEVAHVVRSSRFRKLDSSKRVTSKRKIPA